MSADKYAQFIAEQQKKLSVSGTNPVNITEGKTGDWNKSIKNAEKSAAKHLTPAAKAARDSAHALGDDDGWYTHKEIHGKDAVSKEDWKKGIRKPLKTEETEQIDEISSNLARSYLKGAKASENQARADLYKHSWLDMKDKRNGEGLPPESAKAAHDDLKKANKRESGISLAKGKLTGEPHTKWEKPKGKRNITQVTRDTKVLTKEEASYISEEEANYLEEMVGKGKLNDILMHHKDNMRHHEKMMDHHRKMADASEDVGDKEGFEHHVSQGMQHEYQHHHHQARYDHAVGLKAHSNAQRELKAAKSAMDAAQKKIADAKYDKKDWA